MVHGERTHKGSPATTKRLPISGRHEDIFLAELDVKRHNREPLDDFELAVLRSFSVAGTASPVAGVTCAEFMHLAF